tara:strand:- start:168 stop:278 length:111 start_codon:yes stop_codon:yes gene_type:complete
MEYLIEFLCEQGLWNSFVEYMKKKGYTDEEIDDGDF